MGINVTGLSTAAREELLAVGRQYGSQDTLAQAKQTLNALKKYGEILVSHGFSVADGTSLAQAREQLEQAGVGREGMRSGRKETNLAFLTALGVAKGKRSQARSILKAAADVLRSAGSEAAAERATATLQQTRSVGDRAEPLAAQLAQLRSALIDSEIAKAAEDRGGPAASAGLESAAAALRAASQNRAKVAGTPAATQEMDLLDGFIVQLARRARHAARSAAREKGDPALAVEFELTRLYRPRAGGGPAAPPAGAGGASGPA
jgi:hypothetical protein